MSKIPTLLVVAALSGMPMAISAQTQSPDQQQEAKPKPSPKANQPQTDTAQPQTGQSPDIQQEKNGTTNEGKAAKKNKNNARQGHGTPKTKSETSTSH